MTDRSPDKVLRLQPTLNMVGLSRPTVYRLVALGQFPRPIKLGARAVGWRLSALESWLQEREASSQNDAA